MSSSDVFQDGRAMFTPASFNWSTDVPGFNLPPAISPPSVNPMDPPPPADFEAIMAELFSFIPSADDVQSSDTTHMPNNGAILDPAFYSSDIPSLIPVDQLTAASFQSSLPNQSPTSPMMSFATSGLQDISNTNFINFAVNAYDTSSQLIQKDERSVVVGVLVSHILLCVLITT